MINKRQHLEGRINVSIGDIIFLTNPAEEKEASGYVTQLKETEITLSHENPYKPVGVMNRSGNPLNFDGITSGKRRYYLRNFTDYEVLKKHNPD